MKDVEVKGYIAKLSNPKEEQQTTLSRSLIVELERAKPGEIPARDENLIKPEVKQSAEQVWLI